MTSAWLVRAIPVLGLVGLLGCASAPETRTQQASLIEQADNTVLAMVERDPSLGRLLDTAAGYAVFPEVGEGGFIVGAQMGVGVVYQRGEPIGFATLRQGSVGAQAGGRAFAEIIVMRTEEALNRLRNGDFDLTAQASATVIESGAADAASTAGDTTVFVDDESGLMVSAAVGGQQVDFEPLV